MYNYSNEKDILRVIEERIQLQYDIKGYVRIYFFILNNNILSLNSYVV
jgi:hypothetical protein